MYALSFVRSFAGITIYEFTPQYRTRVQKDNGLDFLKFLSHRLVSVNCVFAGIQRCQIVKAVVIRFFSI